MKTLRIVLALVLTLVLAGPLMAQKKEKKAAKVANAAAQQVDNIVKDLKLTDDQKSKLDALKKEYEPKLGDVAKKIQDLQKDMRASEKELREKVMANLTDDQKAQLKPKKAEKKAEKKADGKKGDCKKDKKADTKTDSKLAAPVTTDKPAAAPAK